VELQEALADRLKEFKQAVEAFDRSRMKPETFQSFDRDKFLHPEDPYQSELAEILIEPCQQLMMTCERLAKEVTVQAKRKID
jgi:hypothetical protein